METAMVETSDRWSNQRRIMAQRIAAVLYGVIAIMTADLALQPGRFGYVETALGTLLIGFAMTLTRFFVRVVTKEAEIGAHVSMAETGLLVRDSLWVMLFPAITALVIAVAAFTATRWTVLLDTVLYFGVATVFAVGFLSSYILDNEIRPALSRGAFWTLLSLVLLAAKTLI
jgi:hypothetical protein